MADGGMPTVGEILKLHEDVEFLLEGADGEVEPGGEIEAALARLAGDLDTKIRRLRNALDFYSKRAELRKARAENIRGLAKSDERKALSCEGAIRVLLEGTGRKSYAWDEGEVRLGKHRVETVGTPSFDDPGLAEYVVRRPVKDRANWKKTAIGEALAEGKIVPGFRRVRGVSVR